MAKFGGAASSGTRAGAIGAACHGTTVRVPPVREAFGLTSPKPVALGGTIKFVAEADSLRQFGACTWAQFGGTQGSDPSELLCRQDL